MTLRPDKLNQPSPLDDQIAALKLALTAANAHVQTLFREGRLAEISVAEAECRRLRLELSALTRKA